MRYFVFVDSHTLLPPLVSIPAPADEVYLLFIGRMRRSGMPAGTRRVKVVDFKRLAALKPGAQDRAIINLPGAKDVENIIYKIRHVAPRIPLLVMDTSGRPGRIAGQCQKHGNIGVVAAGAVLEPIVDEKWREMEMAKRIAEMKKAINPEKPLWILTQNDPDPDAIGSAMALREILKMKKAPIVSLKEVSRNENISMIGLLGVSVRKVTPTQLRRAAQIATVDVQPGYFPFRIDNIKIVIDHHPLTARYGAPFTDIREGYGATSTILTEYLVADGVKISPRLATALYYAIKTDTLLLGRDVSHADFKAFAALWPIANHQTVSQMERPRLKSHEVDVFIRALRGHTIARGCLFAPLGNVLKEDLVPRLADFVMQIGEPEFGLVWGIIGGKVTFAARSLNPAIDAGETMKKAFGHLGAAGGHAVMARATVPLATLRSHFRAGAPELIKKRILSIITALKRSASRRKYKAK